MKRAGPLLDEPERDADAGRGLRRLALRLPRPDVSQPYCEVRVRRLRDQDLYQKRSRIFPAGDDHGSTLRHEIGKGSLSGVEILDRESAGYIPRGKHTHRRA